LAGEGEVVRPNTVSIRCGGWEGPRTPKKNETVILVIYGCFWLFFITIFNVTHCVITISANIWPCKPGGPGFRGLRYEKLAKNIGVHGCLSRGEMGAKLPPERSAGAATAGPALDVQAIRTVARKEPRYDGGAAVSRPETGAPGQGADAPGANKAADKVGT
jgi:hypothetical protein